MAAKYKRYPVLTLLTGVLLGMVGTGVGWYLDHFVFKDEPQPIVLQDDRGPIVIQQGSRSEKSDPKVHFPYLVRNNFTLRGNSRVNFPPSHSLNTFQTDTGTILLLTLTGKVGSYAYNVKRENFVPFTVDFKNAGQHHLLEVKEVLEDGVRMRLRRAAE